MCTLEGLNFCIVQISLLEDVFVGYRCVILCRGTWKVNTVVVLLNFPTQSIKTRAVV